MKSWTVRIKKKAQKQLGKLPSSVSEKTAALVFDLERNGINPGPRWNNFSSLGQERYHCHLSYSYVACWERINGELRLMEVYYVGSRENAPY